MTTKLEDLQNVTADNMDSVTGQQLTEKQAKALRGLRAAYENISETNQDGVWGCVYLDNVDYDGTSYSRTCPREFSGVTGSLAAKGLYEAYGAGEYEAFGLVRIA